MSIALIDTSVFCNIVPVPGRDQKRDEVLAELTELIKAKTVLLLPMAAVLETGNHIAQCGSGQQQRKAAQHFCEQVAKAIEGTAPWTPTPFWEIDALKVWLGEFPDKAMRGVGMGDLSIIKEWERQCALNRARRVFIWSLDGSDLSGYDRHP
ncbi:MAG: hypothetical protein NTV08_16725 [Verrucomicrobia bacterium]|nr:hypothetical protein [Verrucomicrobiota bacterium]